MKPKELISSAKAELEEEEQKITEIVIENIYEKMKSNIKSSKQFDPVDISQEIRSNYNNKISSKISENVVNRFEEDGYYIWNGCVFISRHSCKKWHLKLMLRGLPILILVVIYIIAKLTTFQINFRDLILISVGGIMIAVSTSVCIYIGQSKHNRKE